MAIVRNSIKFSSGGGGSDITVVANYSALPDPTTVSGKFYWCSASQGTSWLPGSLGGTYYNSGMYYSNGTTWEFLNVPYNATLSEVNTGTNNDKFVTPSTLSNSNWSFTTAKVLATLLTGISFATGGAIVSTDSVLVAFGKIQKQISDLLATGSRLITTAEITKLSNTSGTNSGDNATNTTSNTYADGKVIDSITDGVTDKAPSQNAVFDALDLKFDKTGGDLTGTAGAGYLGLPSQSSTPSTPASGLMKIFADASGRLSWITSLGFKRTFISSTLTADRIYTLKDRDGILADDTDLALKQNKIIVAKKVTASTAVTGTTSESILETITINANEFATNDIMKVLSATNKTGTAGTLLLRIRINTSNTLTGSTVVATSSTIGATGLSGSGLERHFNLRTGNVLEGLPFTTASQYENGSLTVARSTTTLDPTAIFYIFLTAQLGSAADSVVNSQYLIEKY